MYICTCEDILELHSHSLLHLCVCIFNNEPPRVNQNLRTLDIITPLLNALAILTAHVAVKESIDVGDQVI